jgi:hypothetical protein
MILGPSASGGFIWMDRKTGILIVNFIQDKESIERQIGMQTNFFDGVMI